MTSEITQSSPSPLAKTQEWRICLVMPTRNEEATLRNVVDEIRSAFREANLREPVLIISDDSHDRTRALARELGVHVVNGEGKGLGFAMHKGLKAALAFNPDVVVSMDSDGQSDPHEIMKFLAPIATGEADMVLGSRFLIQGLVGYRYRWINRLGVIILSGFLRHMTGLPITDSHGGLRAMKSDVVRELEILGTHTYVQESIIDAHRKGFIIREVPSIWRQRVAGQSRVVGSISKYIMYTLPILLIHLGSHVRWLYRLSFGLCSASVLYFLVVLWESGFSKAKLYDRIPALICISMLFIIGIQMFTLGFMTEMMRLLKLRIDQVNKS